MDPLDGDVTGARGERQQQQQQRECEEPDPIVAIDRPPPLPPSQVQRLRE